jgi:hypothetical protein
MKKALLFLLAFIFTGLTQAQTWCAPGAEWHYRVYNPFMPYQDGYMKVTVTSTIVQGNTTYYTLDGGFIGQVNTVNSPTVALSYFSAKIYEDNKVLYVYNQTTSVYDTIANFNANIGDKWRMTQKYNPNQMPCTFPRPVLTVIDTDHVVINSVNLKRIKIVTPSSQTLTLVEKIGGIDSFMYPYFVCIVDDYSPGSFVCYSDNSFPLYQNPGYNLPCNFTTVGKEEFTLDGLELSVFPNPASDNIKIEFSGENTPEQFQVQVYDLLGKEVVSGTYSSGSSLDLAGIKEGLYTLNLVSDGQILARRKLVVSEN